jgi:hypothetical protein
VGTSFRRRIPIFGSDDTDLGNLRLNASNIDLAASPCTNMARTFSGFTPAFSRDSIAFFALVSRITLGFDTLAEKGDSVGFVFALSPYPTAVI